MLLFAAEFLRERDVTRSQKNSENVVAVHVRNFFARERVRFMHTDKVSKVICHQFLLGMEGAGMRDMCRIHSDKCCPFDPLPLLVWTDEAHLS